MGKASRKKQSLSQSGKPAGFQPGKLEKRQADRPAGSKTALLSRPFIHLFIIVLLGFLAYSNTFQSPFQWDETDFLLGNPIVKDLGFFAEPSRAVGLPAYDALKSRYIGYLTFALNYKLHGFNLFGYHAVNLLIHIANALLVYVLVLLTFQTPFFNRKTLNVNHEKLIVRSEEPENSRFTMHDPRTFAFVVALLFATHPIQTEAVTYIFQRLASLVSMFYLLSLVFYIKGRLVAMGKSTYRLSPIAFYLLSLLSAVLAMKTKENAFTLPVIITLYELFFFSGPIRSRVLRLAPFLLTMLIIPVTIMGLESTAGEIISQIKDPASLGYQELSRTTYFVTQFRVIVTYISLLFVPANQNIDYDYPIYHSIFDPPVLLSFLLLSFLFGAAVWLIYKSRSAVSRTKEEMESDRQDAASLLTPRSSLLTSHYSRLIGFGILWFFIALSVESSIISIPMVIDEYRAYLPSIGFFITLVAGAVILLQQISRFISFGPHTGGFAGENGPAWGRHFTKAVAFVFTLVILALSGTTYARNTLWKDKISLWEDVVAKSPDSSRGYNNLGIAYNEKGMNEKAISMYQRCIELTPFQKDVHINLGIAYAMTSQIEKAIEEFTKAMSITPGKSVIYENLALLYAQTDQFDKAAEIYLKAVALNPYNSKAYHGLGTSYTRLGRVDDAIAAYTKFVSLSPNDPEAYRNRGLSYLQKGDVTSAREDFRKSCSLGNSQACESMEKIR